MIGASIKALARPILKHTIKEHQITTAYNLIYNEWLLKHTIKEHQITTRDGRGLGPEVLKHTIKEHQITTTAPDNTSAT